MIFWKKAGLILWGAPLPFLLLEAGLRLAGGVQTSHDRPDRDLCDMDLTLLPDGPALRISQDLGPLAQGCRLDADALAAAFSPRTRLVLLNTPHNPTSSKTFPNRSIGRW